MLKILFEWLDQNPSAYAIMVAGPTLLVLAWALIPAIRSLRDNTPKPASVAKSGLLFLLFLFAWRWPWLLSAQELGPDESQHVAGILTLATDPVFFRSVDGSTAGPMNFYLPLPVGLALGAIDYFTVRLAGLLMIWAGLVFGFSAARQWCGSVLARLGLLAPLFFCALTTDLDFLHYSTEHVPVFLTCVALGCLAYGWTRPQPHYWYLAAGAAVGLAPWGKLQVGPIVAGLALCALVFIATQSTPARTRIRSAGALLAGILAPNILIVLLLAAKGLLALSLQRYLLQNFVYVEGGTNNAQTYQEFWRFILDSGWFPIFASGPVLLGLVVMTVNAVRRRPGTRAYWMGALLTALAVFCVLLPGRSFRHYLLLLLPPLTLWGLAAMHDLWSNAPRSWWRLGVIGVAVGCGAILPLGYRATEPVPFMFGQFTEHWKRPRLGVTELIHRSSRPGDKLALWGYAPEIYAESGLPQATRDSYTYWSLAPSEQRDSYRAIFLSDLLRSRPALFVDTVGPGSVYYRDRRLYGHEIFPALAAHIAESYTLLASLPQYRVYLRSDLVTERKLPDAEIQSIVRNGRASAPGTPLPDRIEPSTVRNELIGKDWVRLLLPPAHMVWSLRGTERVVEVDYGFHPQAVAAKASNGAMLIVEIQSPGRPAQSVFARLVQTTEQPGDAKHLTTRIVLPPFPAGSLLSVRTEPGPFGDNAWDWLYLAQLRFYHVDYFIDSQFPGFGRIPETFSSEAAYFSELAGNRILMQHAPASFSLPLLGTETMLEFGFGFQTGAYTGEGQTDGAVFKAMLVRSGEAPRLLFTRSLNPVAQADDRGPQHASVVLDHLQANDRLLFQIDAGSSAAWDWTYVSDLKLR